MSLVDREQVERLMILAGALRSGLIDLLAAGPVTAAAAANTLSADTRACRIVLDALVALQVADELAEEHEGRAADITAGPPTYSLSALGRRHLVDPGPQLERNWILHQSNKARGLYELPYIITHGRQRPSLRAKRDGKACALTMAEGDPAPIEEAIDRILTYLAPAVPRNVLDVGGAVGHVSARFAARGIRPTLLDLPDIVELARERLGATAAEMDFCACDLLEELPRGPFDLVFVGNIYHIYGPRRNAGLTARIVRALAPGGAVAAVDCVWDRSSRAALFAVNMLQSTKEGGVWRETEFRGWFQRAGLVDVEVQDLVRGSNQLLLGRKPAE